MECVYARFRLIAKFFCVGDKINPVLMTKCPTQLEYGAIDVVKPENLTLVDLYKANEMLYAIVTLGQGKNHRMALLSKTKSEKYPNGLLSEYVSKAKLIWDWINSSQKVQRIFNKVIGGMDCNEGA